MNPYPYIGQTLRVIIDRPIGSRHPQYGFVYPLNYGYLPGVPSGDGEDLDAYVLGVFEPLITFTGACIAVIHRLDDSDDKLVLAPAGQQFSDGDIRALTEFQERWFTSVIMRS
ncbi:inorganic pyrophosphatase [bacterium]|nr:inorganic pyrophosphatase [bacterium]